MYGLCGLNNDVWPVFRVLLYFENSLFLELPTEFLFLFLVSLSLICIFLSPADGEVAGRPWATGNRN